MKTSVSSIFHLIILFAVFRKPVDAKNAANSTTIKKVHVVFMNHLDVGYSDGKSHDVGYAIDVLNRYFTEYFPRAVSLSEKLREYGYQETFIYTSHPWLISMYIDCPDIALIGKKLKCPSFRALNNFWYAVRNGTIAWHAGPMNMQTDNMGATMFGFALHISKVLDETFLINNRTHATYSQRDVPGMTKAVLPIMMSNNIKAISVGVNQGTSPPAVPSPFVWKFNENDKDGVLAFWDKGGYPGNPGPDPAHPGGLARDKCIMADGLDEALCFAFRTDNSGPPVDVKEIISNYEVLRGEFPGAQIFASTFDNFVAALEKVKDSLPVRSFEIGDTWIQGISSDPWKISMYRTFVQCIEDCFKQGNCSYKDKRIFNMMRFLIKIPEHTWGAHEFLNEIDWSNGKLSKARKSNPNFSKTELTWHEQRQFIYLAQKALGNHPLSDTVSKAFAKLRTTGPDLTGFYPSNLTDQYMCEDGKIIGFALDGSLSRLYDPFNQIEWASPDHPMGQLTYNTYVEQDFRDMAKLYDYYGGAGYDKPNVTVNAHPIKKLWDMGVIRFYRKSDNSCNFWLELKMFDIETPIKYGAPQSFWVNYVSVSRGFDVNVLMIAKTTTRLPESVSFQFTPQNDDGKQWMMEKMGEFLDPCNVVLNGSQFVHAVDSAVTLRNKSENGLYLLAQDSPLIMWGLTSRVPSPFPVPLQPFECSSLTSVAFNLFNNIWNTNYIYWYPYTDADANFTSRFQIHFG